MGLSDRTMGELRSLAGSVGADVKGLRKKADVIAAIEAAEAAGGAVAVEAEVVEGQARELSVTSAPGEISANFGALEAYVDGILADYDGWEPSADSEEDVRQCEQHRKYLNGLAKQIDEKRKAAKAEFARPLVAFEGECNRIRDKVRAVSARLSEVEDKADDARKEAKRAALEEHYAAYAGLLADVVPYERIADPKWMNKRPELPKAQLELEERVDAVARDWEVLKGLSLECPEDVEAEFFRTLDLGAATAFAAARAEEKRRIAAVKEEIASYAEPAEGPPMWDEPPEPADEGQPPFEPICPMEVDQGRAPAPAPAAEPEPYVPSDPPRPMVCVIGSCTSAQARAAGRAMREAAGITGQFMSGTTAELLNGYARLKASVKAQEGGAR